MKRCIRASIFLAGTAIIVAFHVRSQPSAQASGPQAAVPAANDAARDAIMQSARRKGMLCAWTIGKNKDRVFEAGISNLTQPQCPCLLHVGTQTTDQMLLVRMEQPKNGG
jgi:hypothetical protein